MAKFSGYKTTAKSGALTGKTVWVANEGVSKDGKPALKIRVRRIVGYSGSHDAYPVYAYGAAYWVLKSTIEG